jgi:hypothetical protein
MFRLEQAMAVRMTVWEAQSRFEHHLTKEQLEQALDSGSLKHDGKAVRYKLLLHLSHVRMGLKPRLKFLPSLLQRLQATVPAVVLPPFRQLGQLTMDEAFEILEKVLLN